MLKIKVLVPQFSSDTSLLNFSVTSTLSHIPVNIKIPKKIKAVHCLCQLLMKVCVCHFTTVCRINDQSVEIRSQYNSWRFHLRALKVALFDPDTSRLEPLIKWNNFINQYYVTTISIASHTSRFDNLYFHNSINKLLTLDMFLC